MAFEVIASKELWEISLFDFKIDTDTTLEDLEAYKPIRATPSSAGYDFCIPFDLKCEAGKSYTVPTGYKWNPKSCYFYMGPTRIVNPKAVLLIYPRSSLGFKYGFKLDNTVGVIDADYYNNPANEGHILVKFSVEKDLELHKGDRFCQGIIMPFILDGADDGFNVRNKTRIGGIGSTDHPCFDKRAHQS